MGGHFGGGNGLMAFILISMGKFALHYEQIEVGYKLGHGTN